MTRRLALIVLSVFFPVQAFSQYLPSYGELTESETCASLREQVEYLSSLALEGRGAGTAGEREAAGYVSSVFESYGLELLSGKEGDVFGIRQDAGDTLTSRNVVAYIPGYDKDLKNKFIVLGARMDNMRPTSSVVNGEKVEVVYPGANGNASGLSMLLQLGKRLQTNKVLLKRSVVLVAFGAAECDNAGSWYFLNRSYASMVKDIDAMVNLDMLGTASGGFYAYTSSNTDMNSLINRMRGTLQPVQPTVVSLEPVRSDHRQFYASGIPSVFFTTGMYPEYNGTEDKAHMLQYDEMERELEFIYNFTVELANGPKLQFEGSKQESSGKPSVIPQYYNCDSRPLFLGSPDPISFLRRWVYVYLRYPEQAVEKGIQGRVLVSFTISEKGKVGDVRVERGVHPLLDDEAVRVISASPDWKPAKMNSKAVKCAMSLYVDFKLKRRK